MSIPCGVAHNVYLYINKSVGSVCKLIIFAPFCVFYQFHLFGIVVSMSDYHPRGPGFDSRLYPTNYSGSIGSGTGSTQPREANWVAT